LARICPLCGNKIGFFSGKFIAEKYVCKACFEAHEKESLANQNDEESEYTLLLLSEAYAKSSKYKPWPWSSKKQDK
jgi:hypothetical protein